MALHEPALPMTATDVRGVIDRINAAWLEGPPDEIPARIGACFHRDAVICGGPDFRVVARGGAACAASYVEFVRSATVNDCTLDAPAIEIVGDTATAVCPWTMTYTFNEKTYTESGHDILVLRRDSRDWLVIWRTLVPKSS